MTRPHCDKMSDDSFNKVLKLILSIIHKSKKILYTKTYKHKFEK